MIKKKGRGAQLPDGNSHARVSGVWLCFFVGCVVRVGCGGMEEKSVVNATKLDDLIFASFSSDSEFRSRFNTVRIDFGENNINFILGEINLTPIESICEVSVEGRNFNCKKNKKNVEEPSILCGID